MKVTDPQGRSWTVRRQWAPRLEGRGPRARLRRGRARRKRSGDRWWDALDLPFDLPDSLAAVAVAVAVAAAVVLLVVVGMPLLLALVDVVVVIALVAGGVVGRLVFRRPWTIEARSDDGRRSCAQAVGWKASGRLRDDVAAQISRGLGPGPAQP